jgi:hypothetical protein
VKFFFKKKHQMISSLLLKTSKETLSLFFLKETLPLPHMGFGIKEKST